MFQPKITCFFSLSFLLFTQTPLLHCMDDTTQEAIALALDSGDYRTFTQLVADKESANMQISYGNQKSPQHKNYLHHLCTQLATGHIAQSNPRFIIAACNHLLSIGTVANVRNHALQTPLHLLFTPYYGGRRSELESRAYNHAAYTLEHDGDGLLLFLKNFKAHNADFYSADEHGTTVVQQFANTANETRDFTYRNIFEPVYYYMLSTLDPKKITPEQRVQLLLPYLQCSARDAKRFIELFEHLGVQEKPLQDLIDAIEDLDSDVEKVGFFGDPVYQEIRGKLNKRLE